MSSSGPSCVTSNNSGSGVGMSSCKHLWACGQHYACINPALSRHLNARMRVIACEHDITLGADVHGQTCASCGSVFASIDVDDSDGNISGSLRIKSVKRRRHHYKRRERKKEHTALENDECSSSSSKERNHHHAIAFSNVGAMRNRHKRMSNMTVMTCRHCKKDTLIAGSGPSLSSSSCITMGKQPKTGTTSSSSKKNSVKALLAAQKKKKVEDDNACKKLSLEDFLSTL